MRKRLVCDASNVILFVELHQSNGQGLNTVQSFARASVPMSNAVRSLSLSTIVRSFVEFLEAVDFVTAPASMSQINNSKFHPGRLAPLSEYLSEMGISNIGNICHCLIVVVDLTKESGPKSDDVFDHGKEIELLLQRRLELSGIEAEGNSSRVLDANRTETSWLHGRELSVLRRIFLTFSISVILDNFSDFWYALFQL